MSDRRQAVAVVLATLIALAGLFQLAIRPRLDDAERLDVTVAERADREAALRAEITELQRLVALVPENRRALRRLARALPRTAEGARLLRELDAAARRSRLDLTGTELTSSAGVSAAATAATTAAAALPPGAQPTVRRPPGLPMRLEVTGGYHALRTLLGRLDDAVAERDGRLRIRGRLLTVDGFSMVRDPAGALETTITATAHIAPRTEAP